MTSTRVWRPPLAVTIALGVLALAVAITAGIFVGSVGVSAGDVLATLRFRVLGLNPRPDDLLADMIVWRLRVPRVLAACLVGASLAVAGAVLQGVVRNPLADPFVLGVSSGAALFAVTASSSISALWLRNISTPVAGFVGAISALFLVLLLAQRSGEFTGSRIVLAGVGVGQVAAALTSLVQLRSDPAELRGMLFWMLGSVSGVQNLQVLIVPALASIVCWIVLMMHGRSLNAMAMGDDDAVALGINLHRLRLLLIVIVAVLTGVSVAIAGGVGFVGLMVPHVVRLLTGPDHRRLLPGCTVFGASFLVLIDLAARAIDPPNEYPLTIFTALLGGPFFL